MVINRISKVNIPSGYTDISEERGDLGQRIHGPTPSATKVYVRRKDVMESSGKAQIHKELAVDPNSASKTELLSTHKGDLMGISINEVTDHDPNSKHQDNLLGQVDKYKHDTIENQCALVKDMGLTHGEDTQKVKGMMLEMEKRDNKVAAEMGIKNHQP